MSLFFNYPISKVIDELNNKEELRNFAGISDVPTERQVPEYFSQFDICKFFKFSNSILSTLFKPHKTINDEYIVDATPVACDINVIKQFIKDRKLKKLLKTFKKNFRKKRSFKNLDGAFKSDERTNAIELKRSLYE